MNCERGGSQLDPVYLVTVLSSCTVCRTWRMEGGNLQSLQSWGAGAGAGWRQPQGGEGEGRADPGHSVPILLLPKQSQTKCSPSNQVESTLLHN